MPTGPLRPREMDASLETGGDLPTRVRERAGAPRPAGLAKRITTHAWSLERLGFARRTAQRSSSCRGADARRGRREAGRRGSRGRRGRAGPGAPRRADRDPRRVVLLPLRPSPPRPSVRHLRRCHGVSARHDPAAGAHRRASSSARRRLTAGTDVGPPLARPHPRRGRVDEAPLDALLAGLRAVERRLAVSARSRSWGPKARHGAVPSRG